MRQVSAIGLYGIPDPNLSIINVAPDMEFWDIGANMDVPVTVKNAGVAGTGIIEWQIIKISDDSVYSSGNQTTGTIGDGETKVVNLIELECSLVDEYIKFGARILGGVEWVYSDQIMSSVFTIPENPEPRE